MTSRRVALFLGVIAVVATLGLSAREMFYEGERSKLACPLLSNRTVPPLSRFYPGCPLAPLDRIERVRVGEQARRIDRVDRLATFVESGATSVALEVNRDGVASWVDVPVIRETRRSAAARFAGAAAIALFLVWTALLLARSAAPAITAFGLFYLSLAVLVAGAVAGRYAASALIPLAAAMCVLPASLLHLALTFPRPRPIVRDAPALLAVPYVAAGVLFVTATSAFPRFPAVWLLLQQLLLLETWIAGAIVVASCIALALRSESPLERNQMRVFVGGLGVAVALPTALGLLFAARLPGGALTVATLAAGVAPLPLGYAIARCHLFGLELDVRHAATRALEVAALTTGLFAVVIGMDFAFTLGFAEREPPVLFAAILGSLLIGGWLRDHLRIGLGQWMEPAAEHWERLAAHFEDRLGTVGDVDACARLAAEALTEALEARGVAVFLCDETGARLAHATGEPSLLHAALAETALSVARDNEVHRVPSFPEGDEEQQLARAGVEALCALVHEGSTLGVALVGASRRGNPYTSRHMTFLRAVGRHAARALRRAESARDLATAERFAAFGRLRAFLLHDLGKPLGSLELLARRLPQQLDDSVRARRDAAAIASLAAQVRTLVSQLRQSATTCAVADAAAGGAAEVIEDALRSVANESDRQRISLRVAGGLPPLGPASRAVSRALANILDNALEAGGDVIEVAARIREGAVEIEVIDHGCGMSLAERRRAFDPFFTTRAPEGGQGLGLAISREIIESLGGRIALDSELGRGTTVRIAIPLREEQISRAADEL